MLRTLILMREHPARLEEYMRKNFHRNLPENLFGVVHMLPSEKHEQGHGFEYIGSNIVWPDVSEGEVIVLLPEPSALAALIAVSGYQKYGKRFAILELPTTMEDLYLYRVKYLDPDAE